jgi:hypothetical protein
MGPGAPLPHLYQDWADPSAPGPGPPLPHLRRDWAHRCHICAGTGPTLPTSSPGLGIPLPHLLKDWAPHLQKTVLISATSTPGPGSPIPHLHRDWAHSRPHRRRDIYTGTGFPPATSSPGLGSSLPRGSILPDRVHPCHFYAGTGFANTTTAPRLGTSAPHLHQIAAMCLHWFNLYTVAVYLQIAFFATIALAASTLAIAAHHQSQKCAALFASQRSLAFDFGFDEGEADFLCAARWAVRWICRPTYAF